MIVKLLHSSSSGNASSIETEDGSTKIMLDAGVSYKKICEAYGGEYKPNALVITHEHSDHIKGAGVMGRKTKCKIYINELSYEAKEDLFVDCDINFIKGGDTITIGAFEVTAFTTKHDSKASLGYIFKELATNKKFAFVTDTGMFTRLMKLKLENCNAYFIEADYDEEGLAKCAEYDNYLKERIDSPAGHLSNQKALEYIQENIDLNKTEWIAFGHLSKHTNSPETLSKLIEYKMPKEHINKFKVISSTTKLII